MEENAKQKLEEVLRRMRENETDPLHLITQGEMDRTTPRDIGLTDGHGNIRRKGKGFEGGKGKLSKESGEQKNNPEPSKRAEEIKKEIKKIESSIEHLYKIREYIIFEKGGASRKIPKPSFDKPDYPDSWSLGGVEETLGKMESKRDSLEEQILNAQKEDQKTGLNDKDKATIKERNSSPISESNLKELGYSLKEARGLTEEEILDILENKVSKKDLVKYFSGRQFNSPILYHLDGLKRLEGALYHLEKNKKIAQKNNQSELISATSKSIREIKGKIEETKVMISLLKLGFLPGYINEKLSSEDKKEILEKSLTYRMWEEYKNPNKYWKIPEDKFLEDLGYSQNQIRNVFDLEDKKDIIERNIRAEDWREEKIDQISQEEYEKFKEEGEVSDRVLNQIAQVLFDRRRELTKKEKQIFRVEGNRISEIVDELKKLKSSERKDSDRTPETKTQERQKPQDVLGQKIEESPEEGGSPAPENLSEVERLQRAIDQEEILLQKAIDKGQKGAEEHYRAYIKHLKGKLDDVLNPSVQKETNQAEIERLRGEIEKEEVLYQKAVNEGKENVAEHYSAHIKYLKDELKKLTAGETKTGAEPSSVTPAPALATSEKPADKPQARPEPQRREPTPVAPKPSTEVGQQEIKADLPDGGRLEFKVSGKGAKDGDNTGSFRIRTGIGDEHGVTKPISDFKFETGQDGGQKETERPQISLEQKIAHLVENAGYTRDQINELPIKQIEELYWQSPPAGDDSSKKKPLK